MDKQNKKLRQQIINNNDKNKERKSLFFTRKAAWGIWP